MTATLPQSGPHRRRLSRNSPGSVPGPSPSMRVAEPPLSERRYCPALGCCGAMAGPSLPPLRIARSSGGTDQGGAETRMEAASGGSGGGPRALGRSWPRGWGLSRTSSCAAGEGRWMFVRCESGALCPL